MTSVSNFIVFFVGMWYEICDFDCPIYMYCPLLTLFFPLFVVRIWNNHVHKCKCTLCNKYIVYMMMYICTVCYKSKLSVNYVGVKLQFLQLPLPGLIKLHNMSCVSICCEKTNQNSIFMKSVFLPFHWSSVSTSQRALTKINKNRSEIMANFSFFPMSYEFLKVSHKRSKLYGFMSISPAIHGMYICTIQRRLNSY